MKAYGGSGCIDPRILDLGTSEWSASRPGCFTPRGKSPWYPLDRRLDGPPEPVWTTRRGEKSCPYRDSNSDPSAVQPAASLYTDWAIVN
jgi:hypothetical protein